MAYLPLFNGNVTMDSAFQKARPQILDLFDQFNENPDFYSVEVNSRVSMELAVQTINTMVGNSTYLLHVPITVQYQGTPFQLETIYDIIGWIFSVVGTTPTGANNVNYFHPLLSVYFLFCRKLVTNRTKHPQTVQLTFFTQTVGNVVFQRVCLGANMDNPAPQRKETARNNRVDQMVARGQLLATDRDYCNVVTAQGQAAQMVGHCAETFPFIFVRSLGNAVNATTVCGIAGKLAPAFPLNAPNPAYDPVTVAANMIAACNNCQMLIGVNHWIPQNFL
ncbi:hypothetical protein L218DRAFT_1078744 [Marasmius fiardii PR-910]|nr:hypothetical protein L218DRAFT_1078744 [Marasmius fiardii PR-910]